MITVVIPTILKCPFDIFSYTLNQFSQNELVKDIIIIDNTDTKTFDKTYQLSSKMTILKPEINDGASYNSGMKLCKTKYYLLINDDVACRSSILDECYKIMESNEDVGLIQIETSINEPLESYTKFKPKELKFTFPSTPRACMTGWFQFGRTEDWMEIPKLKYYYGDDLLIDIMNFKKRIIARITSDRVSHFSSSSMKCTVINTDVEKEKEEYLNLTKEIKNEKNSIR